MYVTKIRAFEKIKPWLVLP